MQWILLRRSRAISKNPQPLCWLILGNIYKKLKRSGIGNRKKGYRRCTIYRNALANRKALPAETGSLKTNLISAGLGEGDFGILLRGALPVAERPVPFARVAGALVGKLYREATYLRNKARNGWRTTYRHTLTGLIACATKS